MARKRHLSARGVAINFDELLRQNQHTVAVGNANVNARGDRLGPGGKIIETDEEISSKISKAQQANAANAAYNQTDPKAVKMVSIKDNVDDMTKSMATSYHNTPTKEELEASEAKTPAEVMEELTKKSTETKNKRKIVDKED